MKPRLVVRVIGALCVLAAVLVASPAGASDYGPDTDSYWSTWKNRPNYYFYRDTTAPKDWVDKALVTYISVQNWGPPYYDGRWERRRVKSDAGSGTRWETDECTSFAGPLPYGTYNMDHYNKTWGVSTVRGWVWQLDDKNCYDGTLRDELFIHSQGYSSTADHRTQGCIEIGQGSRLRLSNYHRWAYDKSNAKLYVRNR